jgi:hypothetical protein
MKYNKYYIIPLLILCFFNVPYNFNNYNNELNSGNQFYLESVKCEGNTVGLLENRRHRVSPSFTFIKSAKLFIAKRNAIDPTGLKPFIQEPFTESVDPIVLFLYTPWSRANFS